MQASGFGRRAMRLTVAETRQMRDEVFEVLERYRAVADRRDLESPGAPDPETGRVVVHFDVLPVSGTGA